MTLHLELPQDVEQRLSQAAAQQALPLDAYALSLLSRELRTDDLSSTPENFRGYLESLALFCGEVPNYPDDFWTRDIIVGDDDDRFLLS